jgi:hypothetical protein
MTKKKQENRIQITLLPEWYEDIERWRLQEHRPFASMVKILVLEAIAARKAKEKNDA